MISRLGCITVPRLNIICRVMRPSLCSVDSARSMSFTRKTNPRIEQRLREKDSLPESYEIIYKAPMENYFTIIQGMSTVTVVAMLGWGLFQIGQPAVEYPVLMTVGKYINNRMEFLCFVGAFILSNYAIRSLSSKFPLRIYRHRQTGEYKAIFVSLVPMKTTTLDFSKGAVKPVPPRGILPWKYSRFIVDGHKLLLLENAFRTQADLNSMMSA